MLLRRITQHVKDQNWFAVALDFFIVVVGILIAFQITNWNDTRADRSLRSEYLTQLVDDLRADIAEASDVERTAWTRVAAIDDVYEAAGLEKPLREFYAEGQVGQAPPYPDFESDYPYAHNHVITNLSGFEVTSETFDVLVSNGHFELLRNPELVRQLQRYQRRVEAVQGFDSANVEVFRRLSEMRARHGIAHGGRTTLEDLATAVQSDRQLAAQLETYFLNSGAQGALAANLQAAAQSLVEAIEEAR